MSDQDRGFPLHERRGQEGRHQRHRQEQEGEQRGPPAEQTPPDPPGAGHVHDQQRGQGSPRDRNRSEHGETRSDRGSERSQHPDANQNRWDRVEDRTDDAQEYGNRSGQDRDRLSGRDQQSGRREDQTSGRQKMREQSDQWGDEDRGSRRHDQDRDDRQQRGRQYGQQGQQGQQRHQQGNQHHGGHQQGGQGRGQQHRGGRQQRGQHQGGHQQHGQQSGRRQQGHAQRRGRTEHRGERGQESATGQWSTHGEEYSPPQYEGDLIHGEQRSGGQQTQGGATERTYGGEAGGDPTREQHGQLGDPERRDFGETQFGREDRGQEHQQSRERFRERQGAGMQDPSDSSLHHRSDDDR